MRILTSLCCVTVVLWAPVVARADDGLSAISCASTTACTAVGGFGDAPLAEHWDGTSWVIQPTATPVGATQVHLDGVSCTSVDDCMAVGSARYATTTYFGYRRVPLAEHWDGTAWTLIDVPSADDGTVGMHLNAVSCTAADACIAVGVHPGYGSAEPIVAHWNGTTWALEPAPVPLPARSFYSALDGISCTSSTSCIAVGFNVADSQPYAALAEHWDGSSWTRRPVADVHETHDVLAGVSCSAPGACTALGASWQSVGVTVLPWPFPDVAEYSVRATQPFAGRWNGSSWSTQPTPWPATSASYLGVSCPVSNACAGVGVTFDGARNVPFATRWTGSTWSKQGSPLPVGAKGGALRGVACPAKDVCVAVGGYSDRGAVQHTLAEQWAPGSPWTMMPTPDPA